MSLSTLYLRSPYSGGLYPSIPGRPSAEVISVLLPVASRSWQSANLAESLSSSKMLDLQETATKIHREAKVVKCKVAVSGYKVAN